MSSAVCRSSLFYVLLHTSLALTILLLSSAAGDDSSSEQLQPPESSSPGCSRDGVAVCVICSSQQATPTSSDQLAFIADCCKFSDLYMSCLDELRQLSDTDKRSRFLLGKRSLNELYGVDDSEGQYDLGGSLLDEDKRIRNSPFLGKRRNPFLGKRKMRPFLGKRANPFTGKRTDETEETVEDKRRMPFLGK